jgi:CRISPR-associated protein Csm1
MPNLRNSINKEALDLKYLQENFNGYLLKGDISGIQEFIFNVTSKKAAKTLKSRSYYIQMVSDLALNLILEKFHESKRILYNGGGNFYIFLSSDEFEKFDIYGLQKEINKELQYDQIYLALSAIKLSGNFGQSWIDLKLKSNKNKLQKFKGQFELLETPFNFQEGENDNDIIRWRTITKQIYQGLTEKKWSDINGNNLLFKADLRQKFNSDIEQLIGKLPNWTPKLRTKDLYKEYISKEVRKREADKDAIQVKDGNIIDFHIIEGLAGVRTGTPKLGVLKMDVDNLSKWFNKINTPEEASWLSQAFSYFFDKKVFEIWEGTFMFSDHENIKKEDDPKSEELKKSQEDHFCNNIYPIFSGGDDCFFVGGWDAILLFAKEIREYFALFNKELKTILPQLFNVQDQQITLSAGLIIVDENYPVVRFAELVEEALHEAKLRPEKNSINIFNENLDWQRFYDVINLKDKLFFLIKIRNESRAILERIKHSAKGFNKTQKLAALSHYPFQEIWRLKYYLSKVKKENVAFIEKHVFNDYEDAIINAFTDKTTTNPMVYPIAARLAEFETRNQNN